MQGIKRIISGLLAFCLLVSLVPLQVFAAEAPAVEAVQSPQVPSVPRGVAAGDLPTAQPISAVASFDLKDSGPDKMDTSYLTISLDKYGEKVSASSRGANEVEVLEYTQWQMSARFVRVYDGKVESDQDVTDQCVWTSTDPDGNVLTVSQDGLVTAYGVSFEIPIVTASYQGMVYEAAADGSASMVEKSFEADMVFFVTQLRFDRDRAEELRCLALAHLVRNDWIWLENYTGKTVSEWASVVQMQLLENRTTVSCGEKTAALLDQSKNAHANSARVLHFISAVAGDCVIEKRYWIMSELLTWSFSRGSEHYMTYLYDYRAEEDAAKAEEFLSHEADGGRMFGFLANKQYEDDKKYFDLGYEVFCKQYRMGDPVTVIGEYYSGTIAKYVSYMTGCKAVTFHAPSPIQYVFSYQFPEFCKYYSVDNQRNFIFSDYYSRSPLYNIEATFYTDRHHGCALEFLECIGGDFVGIFGVSNRRNKEQRLWNRYVYLGDDRPDVYNDTGAIGIKLNNSVIFGGGGSDTLSMKYAQLESAPLIFALKEIIFGKAAPAAKVVKVLLSLGFNLPTGLEDIPLLLAKSTIDSNIMSGGTGDDVITGSFSNNAFVYSPGDGEDIYYLKGFWNKFYLVGYGNEEIRVACNNLENENQYIVTVGNADTFTIDVSDCICKEVFRPFIIYQGTPDKAKEIFVDSIQLADNLVFCLSRGCPDSGCRRTGSPGAAGRCGICS